MDRARELSQLWSWLPAFRAVAETQHLPTAAKFMGLTPSALSRSVKQLEDAIGEPLFVRAGRRMKLNPGGQTLLIGVRDAMRRADDSLSTLRGDFRGRRLAIAIASAWVRRLITPIAAAHPSWTIEVVDSTGDDARRRLLRGEIDLIVDERVENDDTLEVDRLCEVRRAVCCGPSHPLAGRRRVPAADLAEYPFATHVQDGWAPDRLRRIGLTSPRLDVSIAACASGAYLAVVPVMLATDAGLVQLGVPVRASALYVQRRHSLVAGIDRVTALLRGCCDG